MSNHSKCLESAKIGKPYRTWCPTLGETAETATTVEALDAEEAAESYADHLIIERQEVLIGSTVTVCVSTGRPDERERVFEMQTFYQPDFRTREIEP